MSALHLVVMMMAALSPTGRVDAGAASAAAADVHEGGWQLTPQPSNCLLTHSDSVGRRDFLIEAAAGDDGMSVSIPVPEDIAYAGPVQLTIFQQRGMSQPVGRLTFHPVSGGFGGGLTARWPGAQLYPYLEGAERLNFIDPRHRLILSLPLFGSAAAVGSLKRCISSIPRLSPSGSRSTEGDSTPGKIGEWETLFRPNLCAISHLTAAGNAFSLMMNREGALDAVYQTKAINRKSGHESVTVVFNLTSAASHKLSDGIISVMTGRSEDHLMLVGSLSAGLLFQLKANRWDRLQFETLDGKPSISDSVELAGSDMAVRALEECAQGS